MKILKISILSILFALLPVLVSTVNATSVTGSVTVTVTSTNPNPNPDPNPEPTINTYNIVSTSSTGCTVSPLGTTVVNQGDNLDINYVPNTGYKIDYVKIDGVALGVYSQKYSFTNVEANHTFDIQCSNGITVNLSAKPSTMTLPDNQTTLSWVTTGNPDSCTASGEWSGSVNPAGGSVLKTGLTSGSHTYSITCKKAGKPDAKDSQVVTVNNINVSLWIAGPQTITLPQNSATLMWTVSGNPSVCTASGDWSGNKYISPTYAEETLKNLSAGDYTYTLTCERGTEKASANTWLKVIDPNANPNNTSTTGTLTGLDCTINTGESSCKTSLTLSITNPVSGAATNITKPVNIEVANGITPATKTGIVVNYPSTTFFLNHNAQTLNPSGLKINASCKSDSEWDSLTSKCVLKIINPNPNPNPNPTSCDNGATNPPSCSSCSDGTVLTSPTQSCPVINCKWSDWSSMSQCPSSGTQTRTKIGPFNGGADCIGSSTQTYTAADCPSVVLSVKWNGNSLPYTDPTKKIPYSSVVDVSWVSSGTTSCSCSYYDDNGTFIGSCGQSVTGAHTTSPSPVLKKNTKFVVSCNGNYNSSAQDSKYVTVDKINAGYIEQ